MSRPRARHRVAARTNAQAAWNVPFGLLRAEEGLAVWGTHVSKDAGVSVVFSDWALII